MRPGPPGRRTCNGRGGACGRAWRPTRPKRVAARCGIDAATMRELARTLAAHAARGGLWPHRHLHAAVRHAPLLAGRRAQRPHRPPRRRGRRDVPARPRPSPPTRGASRASAAAWSRAATLSACRARPRWRRAAASTCLAEEIETPGAGPGQGADRDGRQPGAVGPNGPRLAAALDAAGLHGQPRHLPQRDHAPRRRDPARACRRSRSRTTTSASRSSRTATTRATARPRWPRQRRPAGRVAERCCASRAIAAGLAGRRWRGRRRRARRRLLARGAATRRWASRGAQAVFAAPGPQPRRRAPARPGAARRAVRRPLRPEARRA